MKAGSTEVGLTNGKETFMNLFGKMWMAIIVLAISHNFAQAQQGWNWPEDPQLRDLSREKYIVSNDYRKSGQYDLAVPPLHWLLKNTPELNKSIYISGVNIYSELADVETDSARRLVLADSVLILYDLRIQYYGEEASVIDRKAMDGYKYFREVPSRYASLIADFERSIELNGINMNDGNTFAYFDIVKRAKTENDQFSDEEIIEKYDLVTTLINEKIEAGHDAEKLEMFKNQIDGFLNDLITIDCNFIQNTLGPKFAANPDDIKTAKQIVIFSLQNKCASGELFMTASQAVFEKQPDYGIARLLAAKSKQDGDFETASKFFAEAAGLTEDNSKKADSYLELGDIAARRGRKSQARAHYYKALELDPSKREAYTFIGSLYYSSFNQCAGKVDWVADRAVYIAAYEMFKKGGNSKMMAIMQEQFPSAEELFTGGYSVGDEFKVGCWINETVTLQKR
ncbi:tetratricopeptide repeat protein [Fulvivirgaceae bacterium LMO-SS25]